MKVWWSFMCDRNHSWEAFIDYVGEEPPAHLLVCPHDGEPAVIGSRAVLADRVVVAILPATAVGPSGGVTHEREFFLEISTRDRVKSLSSSKSYSWDDAVRRAGLFRGATWEEAARKWGRMGLGADSEAV